MSLDYSTPWSPRSYPASAIRCRSCDLKFQAGSVPSGDPICAECATGIADDQLGLFEVDPATPTAGGLL